MSILFWSELQPSSLYSETRLGSGSSPLNWRTPTLMDLYRQPTCGEKSWTNQPLKSFGLCFCRYCIDNGLLTYSTVCLYLILCQVSFLPVNNLLQVGPQHNNQLLEGTPLLHIERHFLLIFLVFVFLSQRDEDQWTFLNNGLAQSVEVLTILRGNIL